LKDPFAINFVRIFIFYGLLLILSFLVLWILKKRNYFYSLFYFFIIALGFSFLALTIGILAGNSREPAINTTITAFLSFLGIFITYLFTKNKSNQEVIIDRSNIIALIILLVFPLCLLTGALVGAENRSNIEEKEKEGQFNTLNLEKQFEYQLKNYEDSIKMELELYKDTVIDNNTRSKMKNK